VVHAEQSLLLLLHAFVEFVRLKRCTLPFWQLLTLKGREQLTVIGYRVRSVYQNVAAVDRLQQTRVYVGSELLLRACACVVHCALRGLTSALGPQIQWPSRLRLQRLNCALRPLCLAHQRSEKLLLQKFLLMVQWLLC